LRARGKAKNMVRIIGYLVGLAFAGVLLISLFVGVSDYMSNPPAATAEEEFHKEELKPLHLACGSGSKSSSRRISFRRKSRPS